MTIKKSVSNDFLSTFVASTTFLIATYPVCNRLSPHLAGSTRQNINSSPKPLSATQLLAPGEADTEPPSGLAYDLAQLDFR